VGGKSPTDPVSVGVAEQGPRPSCPGQRRDGPDTVARGAEAERAGRGEQAALDNRRDLVMVFFAGSHERGDDPVADLLLVAAILRRADVGGSHQRQQAADLDERAGPGIGGGLVDRVEGL
jgi:hypothetical protein